MSIIAVITRAFQISNYIEAGLWITFGIGCAVAAVRRYGIVRRCWVAAVTLVLFGISDLVEAQTGAWYTPVWLLIWKGLCVLVIAGLVLLSFRDSRRT